MPGFTTHIGPGANPVTPYFHSSDGPTTNPVELPALSGSVLPLYRPDGALAGLVAVDAGHHLNFYPDETLATAQLLLANVASFTPEQEAPSGSNDGTLPEVALAGGDVFVTWARVSLTDPSSCRYRFRIQTSLS